MSQFKMNMIFFDGYWALGIINYNIFCDPLSVNIELSDLF